MSKIDLKKVDAKVKAASALMLALQCFFLLGAVGSILLFFVAIQSNPFGAFMASISAIGCFTYVVDFGNRRKTGEQRYNIIRHDFLQEQRIDAYRSVLGEELDKRMSNNDSTDSIRYVMTGTCPVPPPFDTGKLREAGVRERFNHQCKKDDVQPVTKEILPKEPCKVISFEDFKRKQEAKKGKQSA